VVARGYEGYIAKDEAGAYEGGPTRHWDCTIEDEG
jgi:hypothetical protein